MNKKVKYYVTKDNGNSPFICFWQGSGEAPKLDIVDGKWRTPVRSDVYFVSILIHEIAKLLVPSGLRKGQCIEIEKPSKWVKVKED